MTFVQPKQKGEGLVSRSLAYPFHIWPLYNLNNREAGGLYSRSLASDLGTSQKDGDKSV